MEPARRRLHELAETGFEFPFDAKRSASLEEFALVARLVEFAADVHYPPGAVGDAQVRVGARPDAAACQPPKDEGRRDEQDHGQDSDTQQAIVELLDEADQGK